MSQFDELPEGWAAITFGDVCQVQGGFAFKSKDYQPDGVLLVRISNLVDGKVEVNEKSAFLPKDFFEEFPSFRLNSGDVLIAMSGATTGKMAIYNLETPALLNQRVGRFIVVAPDSVDSGFIGKLVSSVTEKVLQKAYGGAQPNISPKELEAFPIPLPPLNEQRRIVEKTEALTARSRKAREALEAIPELLDQFRQSVLAAAFRGDLTADWRAQNPDVEPAEALLERIRGDRRKRWEEAVRDSGKDPAKAKYKEPYCLKTSTLPVLPNSWTWGSLDQLLALLRNGIGRKPADEPPGIPILRISALRPMELNVEDFRYYRPNQNEKIDSYLLEEGDLLFTRYNGNKDFVGVCGRVGETPDKLLHPDKLIRGKVVSKALLDSGFLEIVCNSGLSRKFIDSRVKTSAGQHGISGADLTMTPIPIPPISEQRAIVARVKQRFQIGEAVAALVESKFEDFQQLDQSILAKAFRGELVPQDPNDEPAAVLLERIRAERINSKGKIQNSKRRKQK